LCTSFSWVTRKLSVSLCVFHALLTNVFVDSGGRVKGKYELFTYFFHTSRLFVNACGILYIYLNLALLTRAIFAYSLTFEEQCWLWLAFFLFRFESAIIPFHIWLQAHVDSSRICFY
jgi:hypothetical protein